MMAFLAHVTADENSTSELYHKTMYTVCCALKTIPALKNIGVVLCSSFPALESLLMGKKNLNLTLISSTLDPVSTKARSAAMNPYSFSFDENILPTHAFETAPHLDVLFVPEASGPSPGHQFQRRIRQRSLSHL
jgi:hypothetical protein